MGHIEVGKRYRIRLGATSLTGHTFDRDDVGIADRLKSVNGRWVMRSANGAWKDGNQQYWEILPEDLIPVDTPALVVGGIYRFREGAVSNFGYTFHPSEYGRIRSGCGTHPGSWMLDPVDASGKSSTWRDGVRGGRSVPERDLIPMAPQSQPAARKWAVGDYFGLVPGARAYGGANITGTTRVKLLVDGADRDGDWMVTLVDGEYRDRDRHFKADQLVDLAPAPTPSPTAPVSSVPCDGNLAALVESL